MKTKSEESYLFNINLFWKQYRTHQWFEKQHHANLVPTHGEKQAALWHLLFPFPAAFNLRQWRWAALSFRAGSEVRGGEGSGAAGCAAVRGCNRRSWSWSLGVLRSEPGGCPAPPAPEGWFLISSFQRGPKNSKCKRADPLASDFLVCLGVFEKYGGQPMGHEHRLRKLALNASQPFSFFFFSLPVAAIFTYFVQL